MRRCAGAIRDASEDAIEGLCSIDSALCQNWRPHNAHPINPETALDIMFDGVERRLSQCTVSRATAYEVLMVLLDVRDIMQSALDATGYDSRTSSEATSTAAALSAAPSQASQSLHSSLAASPAVTPRQVPVLPRLPEQRGILDSAATAGLRGRIADFLGQEGNATEVEQLRRLVEQIVVQVTSDTARGADEEAEDELAELVEDLLRLMLGATSAGDALRKLRAEFGSS